jgi:hypothetical protein
VVGWVSCFRISHTGHRNNYITAWLGLAYWQMELVNLLVTKIQL